MADRFHYFRSHDTGFGWGVRDAEKDKTVGMFYDKNDAAMCAWFLSRDPKGEGLRNDIYPEHQTEKL